jgi:Protein of unknown function (DUF1761)
MGKVNYWAVVVGAVAAFFVSSLYYSPLLLGNVWRAVDPATAAGYVPSVGRVLAELARTLAIAFVFAVLLSRLEATDLGKALRVALLLWFGFSALMWIGAIMWEKTPWQVAAIHSGDWLVKSILFSTILGVWHRRPVGQPALS